MFTALLSFLGGNVFAPVLHLITDPPLGALLIAVCIGWVLGVLVFLLDSAFEKIYQND